MAKNERIQIPITAEKKKRLEDKAEEWGFDSSIDMVRFLVNNALNDSLKISIEVKGPLIATPADLLDI